MTRLKVHFDGWLALPAHLRQQLGLASGAELEAELVDGSIVLRPAGAASTTPAEAERVASTAAAAVPAPSVLAAAPEPEEAAREPAPVPVPAALALPSAAKRRGRPPKVKPAA
jgi:antitoxin component of MazEF toxin-antitoxin module